MLPKEIKDQILASEFLSQPISNLRAYDKDYKLGNAVEKRLLNAGIQYIYQIMALTPREKNGGKQKKAKLSLGDTEIFGQQNTPPLIKIFKAQGFKIGEWDKHKDELLEFDVSKHLTPQWDIAALLKGKDPRVVAAFALSKEWQEFCTGSGAEQVLKLFDNFAANFENE